MNAEIMHGLSDIDENIGNMTGPNGINHINSNMSRPNEIYQMNLNMTRLAANNNKNMPRQSDINRNYTNIPGPSGINQNNTKLPESSGINQTISVNPTGNMYVLCPHSERDAADLHYEIHPLNGQPIKCYSARVLIEWAECQNGLHEYNEFFHFLNKQSIYSQLPIIQTSEHWLQQYPMDRDIILLEQNAEEAKQLLKVKKLLSTIE